MPASTTRRATRPRTTASASAGGTSGGRSGPRRAAILGGNRIPFARANGNYAKASNQDMLTAALEGWSPATGWPASGSARSSRAR